MISKAIIRRLKSETTLVTTVGGATRMFAEIGQGEPSITVKQNDKGAITPEIDSLKLARVQLLVSGYGIDEGEAIADQIVALIQGLEGQTISDGARTFTIKSVIHQNGPLLITLPAKDVNAITANFEVNFIEAAI